MATQKTTENNMSKAQSPLQLVRDQYGSKEKLAAKVLGILQKGEEEEQEAFEHRVHTMSNRKLMRLLAANETLTSKHGSREALVDKIVKARFPGGNADFAAKIGNYSIPRLLDLGRQHKV
jgi:tyrosyl-tRNA synthetase